MGEKEIAVARRHFTSMLIWQARLTACWMAYALLFEHNEDNVLATIAVMLLAVATLGSGYAVTRASKARLGTMYPLYGLLCTLVCFAIFLVVGAPSLRTNPEGSKPHIGTLLSLVYVLVSVRATTLAQAYGETVTPLIPSKKAD